MPFRADKSNVGPEMLRWSLFKAAREFGANEHTIGKKLGEAGELAGPDECFCTRQILKALYGELHAERLAKLAAERQQVELGNAIMRGDYLSRTELERTFGEIARGIIEVIRASELSKEAQADIRKAISSIPIVIKDAAAYQRNGRNSDTTRARKTRPKNTTKSAPRAPARAE